MQLAECWEAATQQTLHCPWGPVVARCAFHRPGPFQKHLGNWHWVANFLFCQVRTPVILIGFKRKELLTCHNINEPWRQYAQWKKPVTAGQILCDFTYWVPRALSFTETESRMVGMRGRGEGRGMGSWSLMGTQFQFGKLRKLWGSSLVAQPVNW